MNTLGRSFADTPFRKAVLVVKVISVLAILMMTNSQGFAASKATVIGSSASLKSKGSDFSSTIEELTLGDKLTVGDKVTKGYRRAKSTSGKVGWIKDSDISVLEASSARTLKHSMKLRLLGGLQMTSKLATVVALNGLKSGLYGAAEGHYVLTPDMSLGLRVDFLYNSVTAKDTTTKTTFTFETMSIPVMAGGRFGFVDTGNFNVGIAGFVGMAPATKLTISSSSATVSYSATPFTGLIKLEPGFMFSSSIGAGAEVGYRMLSKSGVKPTGSSATSTSTTVKLDYSGVFFGAGLHAQF